MMINQMNGWEPISNSVFPPLLIAACHYKMGWVTDAITLHWFSFYFYPFLFYFELVDEMESKAILDVSAPSEALATSEVDPQLSALLYDMSQQVEMAMHRTVKMASEISESTGEIIEEMEKCKEYVNVKNKILEEEKDRFQKAAIAVIEFLNGSENI